jgi:hypothetical protein
MTGERPARRHPASAFPEIRGIRLEPLGAEASLVNLSATGILVETASRPALGTALTVIFDGTFDLASIGCRVVRCVVAGIAPDSTLRYHLGLAFTTRLALAQDADDDAAPPAVVPATEPELETAVASAVGAPVLRNRW